MSNLVSFTPLMRQTVGFDRFNDLFESLLEGTEERFETYPPYNIEKTGENNYLISIAVAGFGENDLDILVEDGQLKVRGRIEEKTGKEEGNKFLHRGIATRAFERSFRLADYVHVKDAELKDGLLRLSLEREIPEEKKPRMIPINGKSKSLLKGKKSGS